MKKVQYLLFFIIFLSCSKDKGMIIIDKTVVNNSIKSEKITSIEEQLIDTTIFKNYDVIPLETTNESLFRQIDRICKYTDRIYIFDKSLNKMIIFDDKGKYLNQIHNIGQGPKEYNSAIDFCIDETNNDLILLCDRPYKVMRFSREGEFINEKTFLGLKTAITMDSGYFFCESSDSQSKYDIDCLDKNFNLVYSRLSKLKNVTNSCYSNGKSLVKSKNINYSRRFDSSIYCLSNDSIVKKYEFDFGKYKAPIDLANENDCKKFFDAIRENNYIFSITNVIESERYILFNTNRYICLYDKQNNTLNAYNFLYNPSLKYGSNNFYPNEGDANSITVSIQPDKLLYYDEKSIKNNADLKNLINNSKEDDNPVLIFYQFKE